MQNMQMESNFFYYADVFVNLIEPIAESRDEETLIKFCDQLYNYLNTYINVCSHNSFTQKIKTVLPKTKPNTIETYTAFIKNLKKIPPNYLQWGNREQNALTSAETTISEIKKQKNPRMHGQNSLRKNVSANSNTKHVSSNQIEYLGKKRSRIGNESIKNIPKNNNYYDKNFLNRNNNYNNKTIKGLPNIGLSCYLNTALQSLYYDKQFRKMVLQSSCTGENYEKKLSIKLIFQHLNGTEELPPDHLQACYNQIGHKKYVTSTSDEWRQKIQSWFEDEYKPQNEINTTCLTRILSSEGGLSESTLTESDPHIEKNETLPNQINIEVPRNDYKHKSQTDVHQGVILKRDTTNINPSEKMEFKNNSYQLTFATVHIGKDSGGHYYSYVKRGNTWTKLNDNKVDVCKWGNIKNDIGTNCTFLRYEKIV